MEWWQVFVLAVVEGITEFLPVSSTGHMVLVNHFFGTSNSEFAKSFMIIIQLGAILSVAMLYLRRLLSVREWWGRLLVAMIPTGVVGFVLYPLIKSVFLDSQLLVVVSLALGGVIMIVLERMLASSKSDKAESISYKQAWWVGVGQAISVIPGVSRSMATIMMGRVVGLSRFSATELSFVLAVPTMIAASGMDVVTMGTSWNYLELSQMVVGFAISFLVSLAVVAAFLRYVKQMSLEVFGWYRIALAIIYAFFFL
jgi:undecaprenyl-diphosphatase